MTDTASATVLIQVKIGQKGLDGLLTTGLQMPFEKHAVVVQVNLDDEIKAKLTKALELFNIYGSEGLRASRPTKPSVRKPKVREKKSR